MRQATKTVTIRLPLAEAEALERLARAHKKPVTTYTTELIRVFLRENEPEKKKRETSEILKELKTLRSAIYRQHEGLCYGLEKTLTHLQAFPDEEEAHEWVNKFVGRLE